MDNPEAHRMIGYEDFLIRIEQIDEGTKKGDVQTQLGEPQSKSELIWHYDLRHRKGFPGIPPAAGSTVFLGVDIVFENNRVKSVSRGWMDATGPAY